MEIERLSIDIGIYSQEKNVPFYSIEDAAEFWQQQKMQTRDKKYYPTAARRSDVNKMKEPQIQKRRSLLENV
jgi:hypothetical protein